MEGNKINFFKRIGKSIVNFDFYRIVKNETLGKAFKYLILLCLMIGIISSILTVIPFTKGIDILKDNFVTDIPYFEFDNGELKVESDEPIIIEESEGYIFIVDTTNETDESILDQYEAGMYIGKDRMVTKRNMVQKESFEFSQIKELSFTKYDIQGYIHYLKYFSILIVFFILIWTIIGKLFSTLVISVIGLIINAIVKSELEYSDIYKLGIYSITLPSIIKLITKYTLPDIPFFSILYYGIVIFYLVKAMNRIKNDKINDILIKE